MESLIQKITLAHENIQAYPHHHSPTNGHSIASHHTQCVSSRVRHQPSNLKDDVYASFNAAQNQSYLSTSYPLPNLIYYFDLSPS